MPKTPEHSSEYALTIIVNDPPASAVWTGAINTAHFLDLIRKNGLLNLPKDRFCVFKQKAQTFFLCQPIGTR